MFVFPVQNYSVVIMWTRRPDRGSPFFFQVPAHKNRLVALDFSQDGSLLATASDKGTVIRVFKVPTGEQMYMLRR